MPAAGGCVSSVVYAAAVLWFSRLFGLCTVT
jgi:hypothetical protein